MYGCIVLNKDLKKFAYYDNNLSFSANIEDNIFYDILSLRKKNIYVWDGAAWFAFIDSYAVRHNLINYDNLPRINNKPAKCNNEAFSCRDSIGIYYERKLWLKSIKKGSSDRHKRLSSTAFINVSNFFGSLSLNNVADIFSLKMKQSLVSKAKCLYQIMDQFNKQINELTGLTLLREDGGLNYWTTGAISKAYYLKLFYNHYNASYNEFFPQSKNIEYELRDYNLLLPAILYQKDNQNYKNVFKYDKNSLFPYIEKNIPALGIPIACDSYNKDNRYEYIHIFEDLQLELKPGLPDIFKPPRLRYSGHKKCYFLEKQAFFESYLNNLLYFYDIISYKSVKYYKCVKYKDAAIIEFVDKLYKYKTDSCGSNLYGLAKYIINNLHGKMAQLTLSERLDYKVNCKGILEHSKGELIDTWERSHFDYIRGAYIYACSQSHMLKVFADINQYLKEFEYTTLKERLIYCDTDSMITTLTPEILVRANIKISKTELGAFKIEEKYNNFQVYAPKTYAGINYNNELKITCAGKNKYQIFNFIKNKEAPLAYLDSKPLVPCTVLVRTKTGAKYKTKMINFIEDNTEVIYEADYANRKT